MLTVDVDHSTQQVDSQPKSVGVRGLVLICIHHINQVNSHSDPAADATMTTTMTTNVIIEADGI